MSGVLFLAFILLGIAFLVSTWNVIQLERFVDASGSSPPPPIDATGKYLADLLNSIFPKIKFSAAEDTSSPLDTMDITDQDLIRTYMKDEMPKLMKEELLQLRKLVPVSACSPGGVQSSPSLSQGIQTMAYSPL